MGSWGHAAASRELAERAANALCAGARLSEVWELGVCGRMPCFHLLSPVPITVRATRA